LPSRIQGPEGASSRSPCGSPGTARIRCSGGTTSLPSTTDSRLSVEPESTQGRGRGRELDPVSEGSVNAAATRGRKRGSFRRILAGHRGRLSNPNSGSPEPAGPAANGNLCTKVLMDLHLLSVTQSTAPQTGRVSLSLLSYYANTARPLRVEGARGGTSSAMTETVFVI